jgi:hypothetical protein
MIKRLGGSAFEESDDVMKPGGCHQLLVVPIEEKRIVAKIVLYDSFTVLGL